MSSSNESSGAPTGVTPADSEEEGLDAFIDRICSTPVEDALRRGEGGFPLEKLKAVAARMGITRSQRKRELIVSIRSNQEAKLKLDAIEEAKAAEEQSTFRKDKNTFPRICNFLLQEPGDLVRTQMLASREHLQFGEVGDRNPIFQTVAAKFNSRECSGRLIQPENDILLSSGIDPEAVNTSGAITAKRVYDIFHEVRKEYAKAVKKFYAATGVHSEKHFMDYCFQRVDCYYLFLSLQSGDDTLQQFCSEGYEIDDDLGFDTGRVSAASSVSAEGSALKKRRTDKVLEEIRSNRRAWDQIEAADQQMRMQVASSTKLRDMQLTISTITSRLNANEELIDKLMERDDYNESNPIPRLVRLRGEVARDTESLRQMRAQEDELRASSVVVATPSSVPATSDVF